MSVFFFLEFVSAVVAIRAVRNTNVYVYNIRSRWSARPFPDNGGMAACACGSHLGRPGARRVANSKDTVRRGRKYGVVTSFVLHDYPRHCKR